MFHKISIFCNLLIQHVNPARNFLFIRQSLDLKFSLDRQKLIIKILFQNIDFLLLLKQEFLLLLLKNLAFLLHFLLQTILLLQTGHHCLIHAAYNSPHFSNSVFETQDFVVLLIVNEETLRAESEPFCLADILDALSWVVYTGAVLRLGDVIFFEFCHVR